MFFLAQNGENGYDVDDDDDKNNKKILRKNINNKQRPIGIA